MKKIILVFALVLVSLLLFGCTEQPKKIKVGALLPLTGSAASYGDTWEKALSIALDDFEADTNVSAEILFEDTQLRPELTVSAAQKLISLNKVTSIITGADTLVFLPITENNNVLVFTTASNPDITLKHKYVFRINPSDSEQGVDMARRIFELDFSSTAVMAFEGEYGRGLSSVFINEFSKKGKIVFSEYFSDTESDFRSILAKVKNSVADSLFVIALDNQYPAILRQMKEMDLNIKVFASETIHSDSVLTDSNGLADGINFFYYPQTDSNIRKDFETKYYTKYNSSPGPFADSIYDAGLLALYSDYFSDGNYLKAIDYLHSLTNWEGASGKLTFDSNGDPIGKYFQLYIISKDKFVLGDSNV